MKTKLLKKLRNIGCNKITIYSITRSDGVIIGMRYGYSEDEYSGLFSWGDSDNDVRSKACQIYLDKNIERIRIDYAKFSRKNKKK